MASIPHVYIIWVAFLLFIGSLQPCLCFSGNSSRSGSCIEGERKALLRIRKGIYDAHKWLSWNGKDCCRWRGVRCDTKTGHVIKLDLRNPYPCDGEYCPDESEVSSSLLHLRHLKYLDLSMNNFSGAPIPDFVGSLANLEYLSLSNAGFGGKIPHQLGNLSNLHYLDLNDLYALDVDNLGWLAQIRSLQHLDMSYVNLSKASNWIHVINMLPSLSVLHLSGAAISRLPSTLPYVNFTSLTTLDLYGNNLAPSMPGWMFNLSSLEHLDLGSNQFHGNIPLAIGKLKRLQDLDLSYNNFGGDIPETMWSIKSLRSIDLFSNNFNGSIPETVGNLKSLESLELGGNNINGEIPKTIGSLTKLYCLDLSDNVINGQIPETVGNLHHLEELSLDDNYLAGVLPRTVGNLCNLSYFGASLNNISGEITGFMEGWSRCSTNRLQYIDLHYNNLSGALPCQIGELRSLEYLDLSDNLLNGSIPASLGKLSALSKLDLSSNSLSGALTEAHFANLTSLSRLELSHNSLTVNVSQDWLPPFKANEISMSFCPLGPKFPSWIQNQTDLHSLDLSNAGISENFPNWFGDMCLHISYIDVSHNRMKGKLPTPTEKRKGKLPGSRNLLSKEVVSIYFRYFDRYIDLSNNLFFGPIPPTLLGGVDRQNVLVLAHNRIGGSIASAFCEAKNLAVLDLANNDLSGVLPDCWNNISLQVIDFSYNKLSGGIPSSMGSLSQLTSLHLRNNNLSGKIPLSLQQCKQLITLDLGNNKLAGTIPEWIGESLLSLKLLRLRSNILDGNIPTQLSHLASLQVLDLAGNKLSGTLPPSFGNFSAMIVIPNRSIHILSEYDFYYTENLPITMKGEERILITTVLSLVTSIDLSNNNIFGEIPEEFTNLHGLHFLNLSGNHLIGSIPKNIGAMGQLESLDLSMNNLSSTIPKSISNLNFLGHLNLSYNNLSGRIPSSNQLQTLNNPSIYIGNRYLCGQPLLEKCPGDKLAEGPTAHGREEKQDENENDSKMIWFFVGLSPGFVVGFWAFLGAVMLKKHTRYAYIQFIDRICDWIYMAVTINSTRPKSKRNLGRM